MGDFFSSVNRALFGKKVSITGSGISASDQTLGDVLGKGFEGKYYADVKTSRKAFGITYSSSTSTRTSDLDPALERQITAIFNGVNDSVTIAAELLGQNMQTVEQSLKDYVVKIGRVDLQGLDGKAIAEKLSAVFGAEADKIALSVIPGFERLQKVGEGYFETLTRVANEFETVNIYMARLGDRLGDIGIAGATAADALVQAFGGLDQYTSAIGDYYKTYYTEAERNARTATELGAAFSKLNVSAPKTLQGFRDLVNAQDLTTEAGRSTYAALIQLAPAFAQVTNAAGDIEKAYRQALAKANGATDLQLSQQDFTSKFKSIGALQQSGTKWVESLDSVGSRIVSGIISSYTGVQKEVQRKMVQVPNYVAASLPSTIADYQRLVDAQDATTEAGKKARMALMELFPSFADMIATQEQAAKDAAAEQARASQAAADAAARAAEQVKSAWQSVSDSIVTEINRIRGIVAGNTPASLASAQAQFALATAQARAGDQEAAKLLPTLSKAMLDLAESSATSAVDLKRLQGQTAGSLAATLGLIGGKYGLTPSKLLGLQDAATLAIAPADIGATSTTSGVPAQAAQPVPVLPPSVDQVNTYAALLAEVQKLTVQVTQLQVAATASESHARKTKDLLVQVTNDGEAMLTEAA